MKYIKFAVISFLLGMFATSCDIIEEPYTKEGVFVWHGRKILIYDFTGHKCGNCPRAHETINSLINIYDEAVIPIAIHCTAFARVTGSDSTQPYYYDFRTDIGDYLGGRMTEPGYYGELTLPIGLVNNLAKEKLLSHTAWPTEVAKFISSFPEYLIEIQPEYSNENDIVKADIKVKTSVTNSRKIALTVFIIEEHIINWQTDYNKTPKDIPNYEHNHVLRAGFNGAWGEVIKNNTNVTVLGDEYTKSYSITKGNDWKIQNCFIVAFVYDVDTYEVLQAEMIKVQ
ncbi:MAG: Omp28 family outer membrane lipoprotein [Bacteroidales bacterium]|jgi:hypothetical protein|nr:Omp28 family outer membrane lipoprotein [Bacteroidales bacterium]HOL98438.1 Omp28 family outer membrane lipoprotein [Bacteroidales bacterium]HOM35938.1 Omp28 family outer membrane lipoprotein [Bacteroidales bacterium]HPD24342.1 Omp28 family outer membrane lipoprotein [Bacteroidales bacterium]HRT00172.1 Omp28 family outer membrane lipoprotein [Bacteroidales bacterium]